MERSSEWPRSRSRFGVSGALTYGAVAACFLVSGDLLEMLGIGYKNSEGSALGRFHPSTYLILLATLAAALGRGNPIRYLDTISAFPLAAFSLCAFVFSSVWAVVVVKVAVTPIVETFVMPLLLFYLVQEGGETMKRRLAVMGHVCMTLNSAVAVLEYVIHDRFIGIPGLYDPPFRASALLGHPLGNAMVTGLYLMAVASGGGKDMPVRLRAVVVFMQFLALFTFAGRTATFVTAALLPCIAFWRLATRHGVPTFKKIDVVLVMVAVPVALVSFVAAAQLGLFDTFVERMINDYGSARTREVLPSIAAQIPFRDLVFGPDPLMVTALAWREGTEFGIESFWFASLFLYGILGIVPLYLGTGLLFAQFMRVAHATVPTILTFWIIASSNNSIATKGVTLQLLLVFTVCMLRPNAKKPPVTGGFQGTWQRTRQT